MKTVLKAIVVDDEKPARDELKYLLSLEAGLLIVGEADSGLAAVNLVAGLKPDVIFLDVQMRGMSGLETAAVLRTLAPEALIVFASAYDVYAIKAFEVGALDYLLKPFEQDRVHATVERLMKYRSDNWLAAVEKVDATLKVKPVLPRLPVLDKGTIRLIPFSEVIYAQTHAGGVTVVTAEGRFDYGGTLGELQEKVKDTDLMRVHKSYVVNMGKVNRVIPWFKGTYWLKLEGAPEAEIPVGKGQIKEIKDILGL